MATKPKTKPAAKAPAAKKPAAATTPTTAQVAAAFTKLLKADDHEGAAKKFNAASIVSVEAMDGPMARIEGAAAVKQKSEWWYANHTVHSVKTEGPFVNGDQFAVRFTMDITETASGKRNKGEEIAVYTVKAGKIVEERFYYAQ